MWFNIPIYRKLWQKIQQTEQQQIQLAQERQIGDKIKSQQRGIGLA